MANRLEPLNLTDFTGGLNLRRNQFQLAPNESPEMLNIEVDPRGGISSRRGWRRRNPVAITADPWEPRAAFVHQMSTGSDNYYVANDGVLHTGTNPNTWAEVPTIVAAASPHLADFASWGDTLYVACGKTQPGAVRVGAGSMTTTAPATTGSWNDDYTAPVGGKLPEAEFYETHFGYLFAANIDESGTDRPNRIRWSHPNQPEDWAELDYIDVQDGGGYITGIISFRDHLLIFKQHSIHALYGYDPDSWQLVSLSSTIGSPHVQAITRSEQAVFFFSTNPSAGIFAYTGEGIQEISEPLRLAFEMIDAIDFVFLGWLDHRLWVSVPWYYDGNKVSPYSAFVYDPSVGDGAWTLHRSDRGCPGPYFNTTSTLTEQLAMFSSDDLAAVIEVDAIEEGFDVLDFGAELGTMEGDVLGTIDGATIMVTGSEVSSSPSAIYRTGWLDADWPTRKKSWRRPDYICREYGANYTLRVESFRDHRETEISRQHFIAVQAGSGGATWGLFDWGDGSQWGASEAGAVIERGSSFGAAKAIQLRFVGPDTVPNRWGIEAIVMKYVNRRFK